MANNFVGDTAYSFSQIHALTGIRRAFELGESTLELVGFDSPTVLALLLSSSSLPESHVILFPSDKEAKEFEQAVSFFSNQWRVCHLPSFDVTPYSGLYPNPRISAQRVSWLYQVGKNSPFVFYTATVESILQRTIAVEELKKYQQCFRKREEVSSKLTEKLGLLGYSAVPLVEDVGTYAVRGAVIDIFSPAYERPIRFDLFGDTITDLRLFDPSTQRSEDEISEAIILPTREFILTDNVRQHASLLFKESLDTRLSQQKKNTPLENELTQEFETRTILRSLVQGQNFPGIEFLIPFFSENFTAPSNHIHCEHILWSVSPIEISRVADETASLMKQEYARSSDLAICPDPTQLFQSFDLLNFEHVKRKVTVSRLSIDEAPSMKPLAIAENAVSKKISCSSTELNFTQAISQSQLSTEFFTRLRSWKQRGDTVFIAAGTATQALRLTAILEKNSFKSELLESEGYELEPSRLLQKQDDSLVTLIPRLLSSSFRINDEQLVFLKDEDLLGKKSRRQNNAIKGPNSNNSSLKDFTNALSFSDLNVGDKIVHIQHGIGIYNGLSRMTVNGAESEFLSLSYKDGDKLYLPIYRIEQIQKYSGPGGTASLDKLGGSGWAKTKIKVRSHLRDLASDLLQLYAKRQQTVRPSFPRNEAANQEFILFESGFPYDETDDQLKAINAIIDDMGSEKPMDRLICGDVGFGKTEVAMRAAFKAIQGRKQVAVLAPTTVLSFQHLETFRKRFKGWPVTIKALNRFVPTHEQRKTIEEVKNGQVDILIGTHRILSKDIQFKDLGLLIVDEEQRFGVTHKEKIRKMRAGVDTLTLSATPIPRTLNMSLVGIRDLSLINTPPIDRLPTRTFVCKFEEETIKRAIEAEVKRGGQVLFLHNRVQSIYGVADTLKKLLPDVRLRVGHGQMDEQELEATMIAFFGHEIDVLVCTTIIESGIDNPRANTMFIDNAQQLGLSQLYQLRGRVGRSKDRAYCYLLVPQGRRIEKDAQERLKVIQENTALGSGITIAHHDLELRGAGNLLGENQSGHIESVGYETYLELLDETIREMKGEEVIESIEPDINIRVPALIPDSYMPDLRIRLSWYRVFSQISSPEDMERMEERLSDQFGKPPEPVINLLGLMLIRSLCKNLGIRDISSGTKAVSLAFTPQTKVSPDEIVKLAMRESQRVSVTPDMRLNIRMEPISWPKIYDELVNLERLCI